MMRILIVEDDERISGYMKRGLEAEEHIVELARDGQAGVDMAESRSFDVILLDVFLPILSGLDVCRQLRENEVTTPIFIMTARDTQGLLRDVYRAGADGYFPKPFSFESLVRKINDISLSANSTA
ncbi:MAG: response regulator transcription factor [Nitrospiria bacterium]